MAGYFLKYAEASYIALDVWRVEGERGFEIVFHEYVHFLSRNRKSRIPQPTWYEEGFADAISTARIENGKILVGLVPGGRAALLEQKKWLPLERVVTARGYAGSSGDEMSLFYAQSWLLVHRLTWGHMAGLEPRHEEVIRYLQRVGGGEGEEAAFRATMGASFEDMQKELRRYLDRGPPHVVLHDEPPEFPFDPRVRELAAGESLLLLGELQLARGDEGAAEAEALAQRVLRAEPENPGALLLLAGAMAQQGTDPGRSLTERALALDPDSPGLLRRAARVGLVTLRRVQLEEPRRRALAVEARDLYARAVELAPDVAAAHAGLGYAQLALGQPAEANQSLQQAFLMARFDLNVVLALGELHAKYGRPEDARRLLKEVAGAAHAEEMRARAQELLTTWTRRPRPDEQRSAPARTFHEARGISRVANGFGPATVVSEPVTPHACPSHCKLLSSCSSGWAQPSPGVRPRPTWSSIRRPVPTRLPSRCACARREPTPSTCRSTGVNRTGSAAGPTTARRSRSIAVRTSRSWWSAAPGAAPPRRRST